MPLQPAGTYIDSLSASDPVGSTDKVQTLDDHIRAIIGRLKASFPAVAGAVTLTHAEINDAARQAAANTFSQVQSIAMAGANATWQATRTGGATALLSGTATAGVFGTTSNHDIVFIANGSTVGSVTPAGAWTLNGVAASDFARLSQANVFAASQTIRKASAAYLILDETGGTTEAGIQFLDNNAHRGYVGVQVAANRFITGVAADVLCLTSTAGFALSGDNGNTPHLALSNAGVVTTPGASAGEVGYQGIPVQLGPNGSFTLNGAHRGNAIGLANGAVVTIPLNSTWAAPIGTVIKLFGWQGSASYTVSPAGGVTLYWEGTDFSTGARTMSGGLAVAILHKVDTNIWTIGGVGLS